MSWCVGDGLGTNTLRLLETSIGLIDAFILNATKIEWSNIGCTRYFAEYLSCDNWISKSKSSRVNSRHTSVITELETCTPDRRNFHLSLITKRSHQCQLCLKRLS